MFYNPCKYGTDTVRYLWLPAVSTFCTRKCLAGRQTGKFVVVEVCPKTGSRVVAVALASLVRHGYLVASKRDGKREGGREEDESVITMIGDCDAQSVRFYEAHDQMPGHLDRR